LSTPVELSYPALRLFSDCGPHTERE